MKIFAITVLLIVSLIPALAAADPIPKPKVEFSADTAMEAGGIPMTGKVYHALDRQRIEQSLQEINIVVIARHDKNVGWMIMGTEPAYMELSLEETKKQSGNFDGCEMQQKKQGEEKINNILTTQSRVNVSCPDGSAYEGTMWLSKDGIIVKMEATATDGGNKYPFRLELKNVRIGKQDPKLFEVPAGYQKMGIGGMMGAIGAIMKELPEQDMVVELNDPRKGPATNPTTAEDAVLAEELKKLKGLPGF